MEIGDKYNKIIYIRLLSLFFRNREAGVPWMVVFILHHVTVETTFCRLPSPYPCTVPNLAYKTVLYIGLMSKDEECTKQKMHKNI